MNEPNLNDCSSACDCHMDRRNFLRIAGASTLVLLASRIPVMAGPFEATDFQTPVPGEKKLAPEWIKSLSARGTRTVYRGDELNTIGMPVGGIGAGQLYLGGDGKLWHWDIFNQPIGTDAAHYVHPLKPSSPLEQGFSLQMAGGGQSQTRVLDHSGWSEVSFAGQYPIGRVEYRDAASPLTVFLEAFSPFIPLNTDDSSLPATILSFTLTNTSDQAVEATLAGWLQNGVSLYRPWLAHERQNRIVRGDNWSFLSCSATAPAPPAPSTRSDVVFEDWDKGSFQGWTVEGRSFGTRPLRKSEILGYQGDVSGPGEYVINSHAASPSNTVEGRDALVGKLSSQSFTIDRNFIVFWIGGGAHPVQTALNLVVDGQVVQSATGANDNRMALQAFDVRSLQGKVASLEIVDTATGPWGQIGIGRITFSDQAGPIPSLQEMPDYGTMGLALLGAPPEVFAAATKKSAVYDGATSSEGSAAMDQPLLGTLGRRLRLQPGESATVNFAITWHFPNLELQGLGKVGRHYATRFSSAQTVAEYVATHFPRLTSQTRLWRDTWNDSTLPHWFLERTFLNTSILATSTCYRFANGRFYGWEGVGCCPGTCTHVWHYAQAPARLFPDLERSLREVDFGVAFEPLTGLIRFRAEHNDFAAMDGQAGCILRAYREHQMSADASFARGVWPQVRRSLEFLIAKDAGQNGILDGPQHNTLDSDWYGEVAWLSGLYLAALRAGEELAQEMGDRAFAAECHAIFERGQRNLVSRLFDGEYFINRPDITHLDTINSGNGCEIDQVFGQSWATQLHLGRVLPKRETTAALQALWKYNFTPDVGPYREKHKPGRWYAVAGEAGMLMCTFPRADWKYAQASGKGPEELAGYFNECWPGQEYQVAGHMISEGLVTEGLAITRAVHDRHHAARRNPWNEIECGDHYARSMSSYGVFLATCGYEYHGPQAYLAFAPRLSPEDFKTAFTTAQGWGSYTQKIHHDRMDMAIALKWGRLRLQTLGLVPQTLKVKSVKATLDGRALRVTSSFEEEQLRVNFTAPLVIQAGQTLIISVRKADLSTTTREV